MSIPSFSSTEEADRWLAQQARLNRQQEIVCEVISRAGPVWLTGKGYKVLYSTVKLSSGKFGVVVFRGGWCLLEDGTVEGHVVYVREFVKRKDAKAKAEHLYWKVYGGRK